MASVQLVSRKEDSNQMYDNQSLHGDNVQNQSERHNNPQIRKDTVDILKEDTGRQSKSNPVRCEKPSEETLFTTNLNSSVDCDPHSAVNELTK